MYRAGHLFSASSPHVTAMPPYGPFPGRSRIPWRTTTFRIFPLLLLYALSLPFFIFIYFYLSTSWCPFFPPWQRKRTVLRVFSRQRRRSWFPNIHFWNHENVGNTTPAPGAQGTSQTRGRDAVRAGSGSVLETVSPRKERNCTHNVLPSLLPKCKSKREIPWPTPRTTGS